MGVEISTGPFSHPAKRWQDARVTNPQARRNEKLSYYTD